MGTGFLGCLGFFKGPLVVLAVLCSTCVLRNVLVV